MTDNLLKIVKTGGPAQVLLEHVRIGNERCRVARAAGFFNRVNRPSGNLFDGVDDLADRKPVPIAAIGCERGAPVTQILKCGHMGGKVLVPTQQHINTLNAARLAAALGYVGVMGEQEGIDLLLDAMCRIVHEKGYDAQLVLVGSGPAMDDIKKMVVDLGLADHVTFLGRAPDNELFEALSTADVCVNPDRVNPMNDKSTMNKILEYMAFEKPIVQFDVTEGRHSAQGASLYAKKNDAADMADKIMGLLDDPAARVKMGKFGRQRVERELSWDHQVDTLIAAYQRVATKR